MSYSEQFLEAKCLEILRAARLGLEGKWLWDVMGVVGYAKT